MKKEDNREGRWYRFCIDSKGQTLKQQIAIDEFLNELYVSDEGLFFYMLKHMIDILEFPHGICQTTKENKLIDYTGVQRKKTNEIDELLNR
jgi:hypothetical protein